MRAIGLMSGTSMDGIDIALLETDGVAAIGFGPSATEPYDEPMRDRLRAAVRAATGLTARTARDGVLGDTETDVTERHARAVERFLADHAIAPDSIDAVGFHGQTVLHRPKQGLTVQIGDGAALAARLKMPVVHDLRADDVAAGGEGAPLVPAYHRALVARDGLAGPVVVLNVGGVANITFCPADGGDPIACDTGPGNALIDDVMKARTGAPLDRDGALAARGTPDEAVLATMLAHPFFALPPPKSLDRHDFSPDAVAHLPVEDAIATLTAFTARATARVLPRLPAAPARVVVCGGGALNLVLMAHLRQAMPCPVVSAADQGWSIEAMEAQAFAYLAVRTLKGLPLTYPTTTGVPRPTSGGLVALPP